MQPHNQHPPRLPQRFLTWFLREEIAEEVLGDLDEKFYYLLDHSSPFRAKLNYWYQVVNYLRPFAIRRSRSTHSNKIDMFQNYFKIAWRSLARQKMYSSIKIGGFALGIAACLLIALFIRDELSYDRHIPTGDRLYRIVEIYNKDDKTNRGVHLPAPFKAVIDQDYPQIEKSGRLNPVSLFGAGSNELRRADQEDIYFEDGFTYADPDLLEMLRIPMIYGNREKALAYPKSIVISKSKADKLFPGENPVGKELILSNDDNRRYTVGGVFQDFPSNSHLQYDFMITMAGLEFYDGEQTNWMASNYPTYVLLRPGADKTQLEQQMSADIGKKYYLPVLLKEGHKGAEEDVKKLGYKLQPVKDIHLGTEVRDDLNHGDIRFVWLFAGVSVFILIIACINFINLSTAKSANRAKEVGLRKVVGSLKGNLVSQFLTESLLFSFISFGLGILLAWLILPYFNVLAGKSLVFPWGEWWVFPILAFSALVIGILAGIYPSFYLSSFKPIEVLKGNLRMGSKSSGVRSLLVVFQFTTSIVLIVGTVIIYRQMSFILNKKLGYDKEQVILLQGTNTLGDKVSTFKNELLKLPEVKYASISDYLPVSGNTKRNGNTFYKEGDARSADGVGGQFWIVDYDYIKTMGIRIADGRDFLPGMKTDSLGVIVNQTMVRKLGLKEPIGAKITNTRGVWPILGVVEDFHFESMKNDIKPICLQLGLSPSVISVKVNSENMQSTVANISKLWKDFAPNQPIRYAFLDESFAAMYEDVQRMGWIFTSFSVFAIIVACLGLFALSAFMVEQRSKEIGIRLVLGASMKNIFGLLTLDFVKLILIAIAIASPIGWYLMKKWLEDYEYKTQISWDIFVIAGLTSLLIAILTISYQSVKAALMNPVENLKSE